MFTIKREKVQRRSSSTTWELKGRLQAAPKQWLQSPSLLSMTSNLLCHSNKLRNQTCWEPFICLIMRLMQREIKLSFLRKKLRRSVFTMKESWKTCKMRKPISRNNKGLSILLSTINTKKFNKSFMTKKSTIFQLLKTILNSNMYLNLRKERKMKKMKQFVNKIWT